jgi:hypothetical protein
MRCQRSSCNCSSSSAIRSSISTINKRSSSVGGISKSGAGRTGDCSSVSKGDDKLGCDMAAVKSRPRSEGKPPGVGVTVRGWWHGAPAHKQSHVQLDALQEQKLQYILPGSNQLAHDAQQSHLHGLLPRGRSGSNLQSLDGLRHIGMLCVCQPKREKSTAMPHKYKLKARMAPNCLRFQTQPNLNPI